MAGLFLLPPTPSPPLHIRLNSRWNQRNHQRSLRYGARAKRGSSVILFPRGFGSNHVPYKKLNYEQQRSWGLILSYEAMLLFLTSVSEK